MDGLADTVDGSDAKENEAACQPKEADGDDRRAADEWRLLLKRWKQKVAARNKDKERFLHEDLRTFVLDVLAMCHQLGKYDTLYEDLLDILERLKDLNTPIQFCSPDVLEVQVANSCSLSSTLSRMLSEEDDDEDEATCLADEAHPAGQADPCDKCPPVFTRELQWWRLLLRRWKRKVAARGKEKARFVQEDFRSFVLDVLAICREQGKFDTLYDKSLNMLERIRELYTPIPICNQDVLEILASDSCVSSSSTLATTLQSVVSDEDVQRTDGAHSLTPVDADNKKSQLSIEQLAKAASKKPKKNKKAKRKK